MLTEELSYLYEILHPKAVVIALQNVSLRIKPIPKQLTFIPSALSTLVSNMVSFTVRLLFPTCPAHQHAHQLLNMTILITAFVGSDVTHAIHLPSSLVSGNKSTSCVSHAVVLMSIDQPFAFSTPTTQPIRCRPHYTEHTMQTVQMYEHLNVKLVPDLIARASIT